jgi:energy-coupling factor transport system substrate-specific component
MSSPQLTVTADGGKIPSSLRIAFVPVAIGLNLAIGTLAHALRLPLYLDAIGTIIATLLLGWRAGILTGVGSFLLAGLITNPVLPWFSGTQAAIAIYVYLLTKAGWFKGYIRVLLSGLGLGVVAGIVSAPVIVYLFGGITGSGPSVIVGFLLSTGHTLLKSVFMSGLACEPMNKTLQCLIAYWIVKGLPPKLIQQFSQAAKDGKA